MKTPDKWLMVQVPDEPSPRIFATWAGGYLGSDEWRLNSGIKSIEEQEGYYDVIGESGSLYRCTKDMLGVASAYNRATLDTLIERYGIQVLTPSQTADEIKNYLVEKIDEDSS